ncbi:MAG: VOC family protein [Chloroflexota bacterium]|nr:MAG: VOC family protein [Chloroflexota bacterium]
MYISHTRLLVVNFAECFRFYRDVMGFLVTWGNENDDYAAFTDRESKETTLALYRRKDMAEVIGTEDLPAQVDCQDRIALIMEVENIDGVFMTLSEKGLEFVAEPEDQVDWGIRSAYLRDPDGNLIELSGALDRSKWSKRLEDAARRYGRI